MGGELPEMADWDELFDESYFRFYGPMLDDERARIEAEGAIGLADVEPGAEVLDCPCGFARHSAVLAKLGYRMTGVDRSAAQLAEARRRLGSVEWPRLVARRLSRAAVRGRVLRRGPQPVHVARLPRSRRRRQPCCESCAACCDPAAVWCSRRCTATGSPGSTRRAPGIRYRTGPLRAGAALRPRRGDGRDHLPDPRRRRSGRAALRPPRLHGGRVGRDARGSGVLRSADSSAAGTASRSRRRRG